MVLELGGILTTATFCFLFLNRFFYHVISLKIPGSQLVLAVGPSPCFYAPCGLSHQKRMMAMTKFEIKSSSLQKQVLRLFEVIFFLSHVQISLPNNLCASSRWIHVTPGYADCVFHQHQVVRCRGDYLSCFWFEPLPLVYLIVAILQYGAFSAII